VAAATLFNIEVPSPEDRNIDRRLLRWGTHRPTNSVPVAILLSESRFIEAPWGDFRGHNVSRAYPVKLGSVKILIWPPRATEDVVWAKLEAMRDGAAIASNRLWA
jgi:hypothetical protein